MKILLKAAFLSKKYMALAVFSLIALVAISFANQLEMVALGLLANLGGLSAATTAKKSLSMSTNPFSNLLSHLSDRFSAFSQIESLICVLLCVAAFQAIWLFTSRYLSQLLSIRVSADLRQKYFEHLQTLPMRFFQQHNIGSLSNRSVGDASQIASSINSCLTTYVQTPFTIISTLGVCFYMSWKLSMVIFLGVPLIVMPVMVLARRVKKATRQLQKNQEGFATIVVDFLAGIQTVKMFVMESFSLKKFSEQNEKWIHFEKKTAKYSLLIRPILHCITTLCLAGVAIFGLYYLETSLPDLLVFCGLLHLTYEPMKKFAEENSNILRGVVAAERLFEVLKIRPEIEDEVGAETLKSFESEIAFNDVWFRYEEDWILKGMSFSIKKGETVAIVGPTGAGKSTIIQLLPRLFDIEKGSISVDGVDIRKYTQRSLREALGIVPQKPFLFIDTVHSNIAFGRGFSREEVLKAAKGAYADEFIADLPENYDTVLAEGGQNLSGGQQQRLAIARALVKGAPILVLDEATSALDSLSELRIKQAISNLHGHITQIIIAHRFATIEHADRIIYIEKGRKIAEGTKQFLLETCDPFRRAWEAYYQSSLISKELEADASNEIPVL